MEITQKQIDNVLEKYNKLKNKDVHINHWESEDIQRHKDIMFGKLIGYEEVLKAFEMLE